MGDRMRDERQTIMQDGAWLAHRYDPVGDAVHFVHVTRAGHDAAPFLTDEYLPRATDPLVMTRADAIALAPPHAPIHFIFHSAYCCSTLLARALDVPGVASALKEPVILNDIIGWRHRQQGDTPLDGRRVAMVLDHAMTLLARPLSAGEAVIVKPSNLINPLAPAMLGLRPASRALLLYAPLDAYLGSIARKGMWGRHWVRDLLVKLLREGAIDMGFSAEDYLGLTDLQVAAVGWLAQHRQFARLVAQFGAERIATLDSDLLTANAVSTLAAVSRHFSLALSAQQIAAISTGPAFARNAKTGDSFAPGQREQDRAAARTVHGEEVEMVTRWAKVVADNAGITFDLPAPLTIEG